MLISANAYTQESDTLIVDRAVSQTLDFSFPNDHNIKPKESDFEVLNYVLMSNETGERWSIVTLRNTSSGSRTFEQHHLMALSANGNRWSPSEHKLNFEGNETQSITVFFGEHKFPILNVYTSNSL